MTLNREYAWAVVMVVAWISLFTIGRMQSHPTTTVTAPAPNSVMQTLQ
jgi:hypothetical protein